MNNTVAQTILAQLGGRRFQMMTGVRKLSADGNTLSFVLPNTKYGKSSVSVNGTIYVMRITLTAADDYTVRLEAMKAFKPTMLGETEGVYCDQLEQVFESMTGLYTRL